MPPKKRTAETDAANNGAASSELRRSTRGGGHKAPEPVAKPASKASKPASKSKKAKTSDDNEAIVDAASAPTNNGEGAAGAAAVDGDKAEAIVEEAVKDAKDEGVAIPASNKETVEELGGKRLDIGQNLPEGITLKTDEDKDVLISDLVAEKGAVFFVYPKANTPGCTNQACLFRDHYAEFAPLGYEVYGLSSDSPKAQASWKAKYTFLCDPGQILLKLLGASKGKGSNQRSHYIVAKGGKIVDAKYTVSPKDSVNLALEFIKSQQ